MSVALSEAAEATVRREAERLGRTIEQTVTDMIEAETRRLDEAWLAEELEKGISDLESGRVVTIRTDTFVRDLHAGYCRRASS